MKTIERIIYKDGIVKFENKGIEIRCICGCNGCKHRYDISKYHLNVSFRNEACIVVWNKNKINEAREFANHWRCKNGSIELNTAYFTFE